MILLAVDGMTLELTYPAGGEGGIILPVTSPSEKVFVEGKGLFVGPFLASVSGITNTGAGITTPSPPMSVTIPPSAEKVLSLAMPALRVGDQVAAVAPNGVAFILRVSESGQTSLKGA